MEGKTFHIAADGVFDLLWEPRRPRPPILYSFGDTTPAGVSITDAAAGALAAHCQGQRSPQSVKKDCAGLRWVSVTPRKVSSHAKGGASFIQDSLLTCCALRTPCVPLWAHGKLPWIWVSHHPGSEARLPPQGPEPSTVSHLWRAFGTVK